MGRTATLPAQNAEAWSTQPTSRSILSDYDQSVKQVTIPASGPSPGFNVQQATIFATFAFAAFALAGPKVGTFKIKDGSETNRSFSSQSRIKFLPDSVLPLIEELYSLSELRDGWDGPGSLAPSSEVIDSARRFLMLLPAHVTLPDVTVSGDGEVGLYWKSDGVYIDVGFPSAGRISYYAEAHGKVARFAGPFGGKALFQDLLDVIENI
jgi:hypothetical protein